MSSAVRLTQPPAMKTKKYVSGTNVLNGHDAWKLFEASARGDLAAAQALIEKDSRLVNAQFWYRFPLHFAVFGGHERIVALLLENGADPGLSTYTYDSWPKLLVAARQRGKERIAQLLQRKMQKLFAYSPEFESLKQAIIALDAQQIDAVLQRQPELIEQSDALGNNALHWSVITRQLELLKKFVRLGAPIDARRADGHTPAHLAASGATDYWYRDTRGRSHPSLRNASVLVGALLALGAEYTISIAATVGDQERVEELLRRDPDLAMTPDATGTYPLSYAAGQGHLHLVRLLLERGAKLNQPEAAAPHGRALYDACCGNHYEIAELLLKRGADPNAGVDSCECCLTIGTIYHGDRAQPLAKLLKKHGANWPPYRMSAKELAAAIRDQPAVTKHDEFFDCVFRTGNRRLVELYLDHLAAQRGGKHLLREFGVPDTSSPAIVRLLLARGVDPNQSNWLGKTWLHFCAEHGDRAIAAQLLAAGADLSAGDLEFQETPLETAIRSQRLETDAAAAKRKQQLVEFLAKRNS